MLVIFVVVVVVVVDLLMLGLFVFLSSLAGGKRIVPVPAQPDSNQLMKQMLFFHCHLC